MPARFVNAAIFSNNTLKLYLYVCSTTDNTHQEKVHVREDVLELCRAAERDDDAFVLFVAPNPDLIQGFVAFPEDGLHRTKSEDGRTGADAGAEQSRVEQSRAPERWD